MSKRFEEEFEEVQRLLGSQDQKRLWDDDEPLFSKDEIPVVKAFTTPSYPTYTTPPAVKVVTETKVESSTYSTYTHNSAPTLEQYLKGAAEAWFSLKHPDVDPTVAITPEGKVFVGSESTKSYWLTKEELIHLQAQTLFQTLETISTIMDVEVPDNIKTHRWHKAVTRLLNDVMMFPELPKVK